MHYCILKKGLSKCFKFGKKVLLNLNKGQNMSDSNKENTHDSCCDDGPNCSRESMDPIKRVRPKVGRNDPCICGSQKKFKKCCGK